MSYNQYGNSYQQGPAQEAGYANGYGQEQHELQQYGGQPGYGQGGYGQPQQPQQPTAGGRALTQQEFLSRVSHVRTEIRSLTADVQQVGALHQRALAGSDPTAQRQLDNLVSATQLKNTSIRDLLRGLAEDVARTPDEASRGLKKRQLDTLNNDFRKELQGYLEEERAYRERYRDQISRQYRIVNPDATEQEVRQAAEADWGNEGVFQTALRTNRSGQANAVLNTVRARHNELVKIEQSIVELANLFQDLETLTVVQGEQVERVEGQTEHTVQQLGEGNKQVSVGIQHARRARKLKWWCLLVVVLIIIAIVLIVTLAVVLTRASSKAVSG